jgi:uncharacterized protein YjbI with pentapeptide repeats
MSASWETILSEDEDGYRKRILSRWEREDMRQLLEKVVNAIKNGQPWVQYMEDLIDVEDVENQRDLRGAPLRGVNFSGADLREITFFNTDFQAAQLENVDFRGSEFGHTNFTDARLAGAILDGCHTWVCNFENADLSGASLKGASLSGSSLRRANLSKADLSNTNLLGVDLEGATLTDTILTGALLP